MGSLSAYARALAADPPEVVALLLAVVAVGLVVSGIARVVTQLGPRARSQPLDPSPLLRCAAGLGLSLLAVGILR